MDNSKIGFGFIGASWAKRYYVPSSHRFGRMIESFLISTGGLSKGEESNLLTTPVR
jgi:hypothetical protein